MKVPIIAPSSPARLIKSARFSAPRNLPSTKFLGEIGGRAFEIARDRGSDKRHDGQQAEAEEHQLILEDGIRAVDGDLVAEVVDVNDRAGDRQKVNQREQQQRAEKEGRVKLIANLELYDR